MAGEKVARKSQVKLMADECKDISTQEELSICCRWLVNGCPEEHFLTVLHVKSTDAKEITHNISDKELKYTKLVGQGYDGASPFSGAHSGVQKRMSLRVHAAHALYIRCSCHRLQLASMQAAESIAPVKKMFGTMGNLWKLFYYSPKKTEALKEVQSVLKLPELKTVKPSHTRWLSHERCVRAIRKERPALIVTLQQLYEVVMREHMAWQWSLALLAVLLPLFCSSQQSSTAPCNKRQLISVSYLSSFRALYLS